MRIFITGGAGFIGSNSADYFLKRGHEVVIYDNLSRKGGPANMAWLGAQYGERVKLVKADVRDYDPLAQAIHGAEVVLHMASQVAVTASVQNPREDFEINALGTLNVLEAVRHHSPNAAVVYASTNKVYGGMKEIQIETRANRYAYAAFDYGIPENYPLDFHSPYGCSKGAGDQYTIDYARIYGLKTLVFRQSCIYGRRQFGVEDQGWVAHFVIAAVLGLPIRIYGDGRQVRDLLHVTDLVRAYDLGIQGIERLRGEVFNIGGGHENTLSIWTEFGPLLESLANKPIMVTHHDWRPGDQRVFIADIRKAAECLGWQPTVTPAEGIRDLYTWVSAHPDLFAPTA